jgi:hypothetical protein
MLQYAFDLFLFGFKFFIFCSVCSLARLSTRFHGHVESMLGPKEKLHVALVFASKIYDLHFDAT